MTVVLVLALFCAPVLFALLRSRRGERTGEGFDDGFDSDGFVTGD